MSELQKNSQSIHDKLSIKRNNLADTNREWFRLTRIFLVFAVM